MIPSSTYEVGSESEGHTEELGRSIGEVIEIGDALFLHGADGGW